jgi:hypothetical protein
MLKKLPHHFEASCRDYTLYYVLTALRFVVSSNSLFDAKNPYIVLCDDELAKAMSGIASMHVADMKDYVCLQMNLVSSLLPVKLRGSPLVLRSGKVLKLILEEKADVVGSAAPSCHTEFGDKPFFVDKDCAVAEATTTAREVFDVNASYRVSPKLLFCLKEVNLLEASERQVVLSNKTTCMTSTSTTTTRTVRTTTVDVFPYRMLIKAMSTYITDRKSMFFTDDNIKVAVIKGDPLVEGLGVDAFHRRQITALLRNQLTKVDMVDPASPGREVLLAEVVPMVCPVHSSSRESTC